MKYQLQILIVDDDVAQCQSLQDILVLQTYAVDTAHSGADAFLHFEKKTYDLAIIDIRLGDISGPALVKNISVHFPITEFIYITGFASIETAVMAVRQKQVISYEEKPIQIERLLSFCSQLEKRKHVERGLDVSEERFSKLTSMSPTGIYETDCSGNIIYANRKWCQVTKVSDRDGIGESFSYGVYEEDKEGLRSTWEKMFKGETSYIKHEFRCQQQGTDEVAWLYDEVQPIFDGVGKVSGYIGTRIDVSDRRAKEMALLNHRKELEQQVQERTLHLQKALVEKEKTKDSLDAVFQSIPDGIISVDTRLLVLEMNAFSLPGYESHLKVGTAVDPDKNQLQYKLHQALQHTFSSQQPIKEMRVELQGQKNNLITLVINTTLHFEDKGAVTGALLIARNISQLAKLEDVVHEQKQFNKLVGKSDGMQHVYKMIRLLADKDSTVLVTGESGTGKELVVESLHELSERSSKQLVKINCSALPESLLESELFGHVKGAFTGAVKDRTGRVETAEGGTLFLDEIGDISLMMQVKLLRFIESREYERVGESKTRRADIRIIVATNVDLEKKVERELFRKDFYYRLKVVTIHIPALRQRTEDIPLLLNHFVGYFSRQFEKNVTISVEVLNFCMGYSWPGNVRELKHSIEHASVLVTGGTIKMEHLPIGAWQMQVTEPHKAFPGETEKENILTALQKTDWNVSKAARLLKIGRTTIYQRIKQYEISRNK